jgi:tetratricopeptide (TPR) repeat protein
MQWLRRITLIFAVGIGLSVLALVTHTFWSASQVDPPLIGQRVQDLQILVIILLGLAGLYTVVFLLSPNMSERILKEQADVTVKNVKMQVSVAIGDLRELREEIRQIMREQTQAMRVIRTELHAAPQQPAPAPPQAPAAATLNGREYLQLSGRLRILNNELVQIYQALAALCGPHEDAMARSYLNQALALTPDPVAAAEVHYAIACLLARQGDLGESIVELQTAFLNKSRELEDKLTKDTEEGGPLYALATTAPYDRVLNDLLMNVSVGA